MACLKNVLSDVGNSIRNKINMLTPLVLGMAIEFGLEDQRIGKIVGGAIMALSGLNIFSKALHSRSWSSQTQLNTKLQKISRCGALVLGLGFASYGIYSFIYGIKEFLFPLSCETRLEIAKKQLLSCPEAQQLWRDVSREGAISYRCAKEEIVAPSTASVRLDTREISISETCNDPELSLLFELQNLNQSRKFFDLAHQRCSLDADRYAYAMESLESETTKIVHQISKQCVLEGYWPKSMIAYEKQFSGPDATNWNNLEVQLADQERLGHTQWYRQEWYKQCKSSCSEQS